MTSITWKIAEVLDLLCSLTTQREIANSIGTNQVRLSKIKRGLLKGKRDVLEGLVVFIDEKLTELEKIKTELQQYLEHLPEEEEEEVTPVKQVTEGV